jgi:hypothetical protein
VFTNKIPVQPPANPVKQGQPAGTKKAASYKKKTPQKKMKRKMERLSL